MGRRVQGTLTELVSKCVECVKANDSGKQDLGKEKKSLSMVVQDTIEHTTYHVVVGFYWTTNIQEISFPVSKRE